MARISDPERARQLARTIASDLRIYNAAGMEQGGPEAKLEDEIERGRKYFRGRVTTDVYALDLYEDAIEAVLRPDPHPPEE